MTIATIRQRLIHYLEDADESKVKAIYTLLEEDIQNTIVELTEEHLQILDNERESYLSGDIVTLSKHDAITFIRTGK